MTILGAFKLMLRSFYATVMQEKLIEQPSQALDKMTKVYLKSQSQDNGGCSHLTGCLIKCHKIQKVHPKYQITMKITKSTAE